MSVFNLSCTQVGGPAADPGTDLWSQSWTLLQGQLSDMQFGQGPWAPPPTLDAVPLAALLRPAVDDDLGACMAAAGWGAKNSAQPAAAAAQSPTSSNGQTVDAGLPAENTPNHPLTEPNKEFGYGAPPRAEATALPQPAVPPEVVHWAPAVLPGNRTSLEAAHRVGYAPSWAQGACPSSWATLQQRLRVPEATTMHSGLPSWGPGGAGTIVGRDVMDLTSASLPCHDQFLAECVSQPILAWVCGNSDWLCPPIAHSCCGVV